MDNKEEVIISAAQGLFLRHGLKKVSMSDIAEASNVSRPTLYAVFANKEAVIGGLLNLHVKMIHEETKKNLPNKKTLKAQLDCLFKIWIIDPFASAIDMEGGKEVLSTIESYAPNEYALVYEDFEKYIIECLKPYTKKNAQMSAKDLARILSLATRGLKASSSSLNDLNRLTDGLIVMALSVVGE